MDVGDFEFILGKILHLISPRQMSNFGGHLPIMLDKRLALTLRYIATGESFQSLNFQFRISLNAISYIIKAYFKALVDELVPVFVKHLHLSKNGLKFPKHLKQDGTIHTL